MEYIFYKLVDKSHPNTFYIGSTVNISRRLSQHRKNTYNKTKKIYHTKLYKHIRNVGFNNIEVREIGRGLYNSPTDAHNKEQEYINNQRPCLNTIKASTHIVYMPDDLQIEI
jgi:hypothetical protein